MQTTMEDRAALADADDAVELAEVLEALTRFRRLAHEAGAALCSGEVDAAERCLDARDRLRPLIELCLARFRDWLRGADPARGAEASRRVAEEAARCGDAEVSLHERLRDARAHLLADAPSVRRSRAGYDVEVGGGWVDLRA